MLNIFEYSFLRNQIFLTVRMSFFISFHFSVVTMVLKVGTLVRPRKEGTGHTKGRIKTSLPLKDGVKGGRWEVEWMTDDNDEVYETSVMSSYQLTTIAATTQTKQNTSKAAPTKRKKGAVAAPPISSGITRRGRRRRMIVVASDSEESGSEDSSESEKEIGKYNQKLSFQIQYN